MMVEGIMRSISVEKKLYVVYSKVNEQWMVDTGQRPVTKAYML